MNCSSSARLPRYVEAVSGREFEIHMKLDRSFKFVGDTIAFDIKVDGKITHYPVIFSHDSKYVRHGKPMISHGYRQGSLRFNYKFTELITSADEAAPTNSLESLRSLESIEIAAHHHIKQGKMTSKYQPSVLGDLGVLPEKALKGQTLSHSVGYGPPVLLQKPRDTWRTAYVDSSKKPAATYIFRYRSLDSLKSAFIVPRTPSPEPPPALENRDVATLSQDELRELQRRARELRDRPETKPRIKRERSADGHHRRKAPRTSTVIELDDDGEIVSETTVPSLASPVSQRSVELV